MQKIRDFSWAFADWDIKHKTQTTDSLEPAFVSSADLFYIINSKNLSGTLSA